MLFFRLSSFQERLHVQVRLSAMLKAEELLIRIAFLWTLLLDGSTLLQCECPDVSSQITPLSYTGGLLLDWCWVGATQKHISKRLVQKADACNGPILSRNIRTAMFWHHIENSFAPINRQQVFHQHPKFGGNQVSNQDTQGCLRRSPLLASVDHR